MTLTVADLLSRARPTRQGCLEWQGARFWSGYGAVKVNGRTRRVHRLVWELLNGPLPAGHHALHRCDNPPCIEPAHLYAGTQIENMRDRSERGRAGGGGRVAVSRDEAAATRHLRVRDAATLLSVSPRAVERAWARLRSVA